MPEAPRVLKMETEIPPSRFFLHFTSLTQESPGGKGGPGASGKRRGETIIAVILIEKSEYSLWQGEDVNEKQKFEVIWGPKVGENRRESKRAA